MNEQITAWKNLMAAYDQAAQAAKDGRVPDRAVASVVKMLGSFRESLGKKKGFIQKVAEQSGLDVYALIKVNEANYKLLFDALKAKFEGKHASLGRWVDYVYHTMTSPTLQRNVSTQATLEFLSRINAKPNPAIDIAGFLEKIETKYHQMVVHLMIEQGSLGVLNVIEENQEKYFENYSRNNTANIDDQRLLNQRRDELRASIAETVKFMIENPELAPDIYAIPHVRDELAQAPDLLGNLIFEGSAALREAIINDPHLHGASTLMDLLSGLEEAPQEDNNYDEPEFDSSAENTQQEIESTWANVVKEFKKAVENPEIRLKPFFNALLQFSHVTLQDLNSDREALISDLSQKSGLSTDFESHKEQYDALYVRLLDESPNAMKEVIKTVFAGMQILSPLPTPIVASESSEQREVKNTVMEELEAYSDELEAKKVALKIFAEIKIPELAEKLAQRYCEAVKLDAAPDKTQMREWIERLNDPALSFKDYYEKLQEEDPFIEKVFDMSEEDYRAAKPEVRQEVKQDVQEDVQEVGSQAPNMRRP